MVTFNAAQIPTPEELQELADLLEVVTDATPGVVAANFTGSGLVRTRGPLVYVRLTLTSTNAIASTAGNLPDTTCYTLDTGYRPTEAVDCIFGSGLYGGLATINTNGTVVLRAAWASIGAGDSVNVTASFLRAS